MTVRTVPVLGRDRYLLARALIYVIEIARSHKGWFEDGDEQIMKELLATICGNASDEALAEHIASARRHICRWGK